jgi:hypothetical protein
VGCIARLVIKGSVPGGMSYYKASYKDSVPIWEYNFFLRLFCCFFPERLKNIEVTVTEHHAMKTYWESERHSKSYVFNYLPEDRPSWQNVLGFPQFLQEIAGIIP